MANIVFEREEIEPIIEWAIDKAVKRIREEKRDDKSERILLTKKEAARDLGVSEATIDRLRKDKGLPCVKLDGRAMFRPASLDKWAIKQEA